MALPDLVIFLSIIALAWIVRVDFASLKITNKSVLVLLGLYLVWAALTGFVSIWSDLAAGATLFLLALVMWLLRMMGGGDVKLYAVLGFFVGFDQLLFFAVLLLVISVLFVVLIQTAGRIAKSGRLHEIRQSGKAPYAVPMCFAAILAILLRALG
jgi:Flp pilus assembly protein protease CpaA